MSEPGTGTASAEVTADVVAPRPRLVSLDVTRGLAVAAMLAVNNEGINPGHPGWLRHPEWNGFSVADVVFPLFLFCIGVSSALSSKQMPSPGGPTFGQAFGAMAKRCAILFGLGVGLSALKQHQLVLAGVLQHIAITSLLAWFVLLLPRRAQYAVGLALLVAGAAIGLAWGFRDGHTVDQAIDRFLYDRETAEGLPVAAVSVFNVLAGAWVGRWFVTGDRRQIVRHLATWTVVPLAVGLVLAPWIPVNKRLWTPTYALVGAAAAAGISLAVYWLVDLRGVRRPVHWLQELGANPLAVYVASSALASVVPDRARIDVVEWMAGVLPIAVASVAWSAVWIVLAWVIADQLWRRHVLIKL
ncbi:heparan-alpha-glucosaminide N-acetyltransferase domain-containing protein [Dermatobacter hominis]|uniref:heparan-alpha-glucosaminide N-acetyltransferase domain-containing protein n=1 Tax=Dermatobacter hominis TaxID=2884263 RepID=UPI001D100A7B|nr:heparan-alpha-glucosaminide N-acetyltransferase domain-containing protein [Dermatobacter hominis]UDY37812.1 heparan-alpha-glucosaminide N-acetyltransferase domain-containing protein [Dermatobacter hominis]